MKLKKRLVGYFSLTLKYTNSKTVGKKRLNLITKQAVHTLLQFFMKNPDGKNIQKLWHIPHCQKNTWEGGSEMTVT